jgi:dTDP-4-dehydrorhamnose reductase
MKTLVVGSGGQVGRELMRAVWPAGWEIAGLPHAALDVADGAAVQKAISASGAALVVNGAAYTAVDRAESEPERAAAVNRDGAAHLAEACAATRSTLIHLSTDYVFDGTKRTPYAEDDPVAPLGAYGAGKAEGEAAIRARLEHHLILRTAWVFGAHGPNFVKTMLRLGATRDEVAVVADQRGCPTPAADIAAVIAQLAPHLLQDPASRGTLHYVGSGETTWHGFAEAIFDLAAPRLGRRPRVRAISTAEYPTAAKRPAYSVLSCARLTACFGIESKPWRDGLAAMLAEHFATTS